MARELCSLPSFISPRPNVRCSRRWRLECAQALAPLVSSAQSYVCHRSFYEAVFVKSETLGREPLYDRVQRSCGEDCNSANERSGARLAWLPGSRKLLLLSVSTGAGRTPETIRLLLPCGGTTPSERRSG